MKKNIFRIPCKDKPNDSTFYRTPFRAATKED